MNVEMFGNVVKHCQDQVFDIHSVKIKTSERIEKLNLRSGCLMVDHYIFFVGGERLWAITNWKKNYYFVFLHSLLLFKFVTYLRIPCVCNFHLRNYAINVHSNLHL